MPQLIDTTFLEWELLLKLCQIAITGTDASALPAFAGVDWDRLLKLATRHKVRPLLYQGLVRREEVVPAAVFQNLKAYSTLVTTRNLRNTKGILQLAKILENIDWLPFKGIMLSKLAYQNIAVRQSSDIDILIHKSDYYAVKERLTKAGFVCQQLPAVIENKLLEYNCENKFEYFVNGQRIYNIDVHWQIGSRALQLDFGLADFQPWTQPADFYGATIPQFTPEGLLFNTYLHHGGKEFWNTLKFIFDLYAILTRYENQLDWKLFFQLTQKKSTTKIVLIGLAIMANLLDYQLPPPVVERIKRAGLNQQQINHHVLPLIQSVVVKDNLPRFRNLLKYHLALRSNHLVKLNILYYYAVAVLTPNINDVEDVQHLSNWQYIVLVCKKPLRLFSTYVNFK